MVPKTILKTLGRAETKLEELRRKLSTAEEYKLQIEDHDLNCMHDLLSYTKIKQYGLLT